jgi:hypothetical protein
MIKREETREVKKRVNECGRSSKKKDRDSILKLLRNPGIDSASQCRREGRYDNLIIIRFLVPRDPSKIPAQKKNERKGRGKEN